MVSICQLKTFQPRFLKHFAPEASWSNQHVIDTCCIICPTHLKLLLTLSPSTNKNTYDIDLELDFDLDLVSSTGYNTYDVDLDLDFDLVSIY